MPANKAQIAFQARHHVMMPSGKFGSLGEYCLALMHRRDYEDAAGMAGGKKVLDLGCNNGYGTSIIAGKATEVVGLDVSPQATELARERYGAPSTEFITFDGLRIPFPDDSFGLVVSLQVIEHVMDAGAYLREIIRVLAPGGRVMFTTPNAVIRLDPGMVPWNSYHVREYTPEQLRAELERYFSRVKLYGMFASEPLYSMEIERSASSREIARERSWLFLKTREIMPMPVLGLIRTVRVALAGQRKREESVSHEEMNRFSTADYFYRDSELEASINLKAICSL